MGTQIRVFDRFGSPLDDIDCQVSRSWILGDIGTAILSVAKSDTKCTEVNIRFGNLVLVEDSNVGKWGGIIDLPRRWSQDSITVSAYTPELLLKYTIWSTNGYENQTAGHRIENNLFEFINNSGIFELGDIYNGGTIWTDDISQRDYDCYTKLKEYSDITGQEWEFVPRFRQNGDLYFELNWKTSLGKTISDVVIEEGINIIQEGDVFVEQGEIINYIEAYWPSGGYYDYITDVDTASRSLYGDRFKIFSHDYQNDTAAASWLEEKLEYYKEPQRVFNIKIVNDGSIFPYLEIGNVVGIRLIEYGFTNNDFGIDTNVRIIARSYSEQDGFMSVTVREVA